MKHRVTTRLAVGAVTLLVTASGLGPARAQTDPNQPFRAPQYLVHITGHGTINGGVKDDAYVMIPGAPDDKGFFQVPDGSGGTFTYGSDFHAGPFNTPAEVCAAAKGKATSIGSFTYSADSIECSQVTGGRSTTSTSSSSSSTSSSTTTTTLAPVCNPHGRVIDRLGRPVVGIHVAVLAGRLRLDGATDSDGNYSFPEIGDDPAGGQFNSSTDTVNIAIITEEWDHEPKRFQVFYQQQLGVLSTGDFRIADVPDCRRDFDVDDIPPNYVAFRPPAGEWPDIIEIYENFQRAWSLGDQLGVNVDYGLPLRVFAWCTEPRIGCEGQEFAFTVTSTTDGQYIERPYIALGPGTSSLLNLDWPDNREYHEFGHYFLASAFGHLQPNAPGDENHDGYRNPHSTDSWTEGFAEFYAAMVAKHIDHRQQPYLYTLARGYLPSNSSNAPPVGGLDLRLDWQAWQSEEIGIAAMLYQLESADVSTPPTPQEAVALSVKGYTTVTDPTYGPLLVGRVANGGGRTSVGTLVAVQYLDAAGQVVDEDLAPTIPWDLDAGGEGVFVMPVRPGLQYASVGVAAYEGHPPAPPGAPPEPLQLSLAQVWSTILGFHSNKDGSNGHLFDVEDLYQAFKQSYGGRGAVSGGLDSVDQIFVDHGFYADPRGIRAYEPGAEIGKTSHPSYGPADCDGLHWTECSPARLPRYNLPFPPAMSATVSTGAVDATVFVKVSYPAPNQRKGTGYVTNPDGDHRVRVLVPPAGSHAVVTLVALAEGHTPTILGQVKADTFWDEAAKHHGKSFLSFSATVPPGTFHWESGKAAAAGRISDGGGSGGGAGGAGAALAAAAVALGLVGLNRRRRATRRPQPSPEQPHTGTGAPGAPGWSPSHRVPAEGLDCRTSPDAALAPVAHLDAGLDVEVVERQEEWARVVCANGWSGWVDSRLLATP